MVVVAAAAVDAIIFACLYKQFYHRFESYRIPSMEVERIVWDRLLLQI